MSLTLFAIQNAKPKEKPYKLSDGKGLHCGSTRTAASSGAIATVSGGKENMLGLGPFPEVSLAAAREKRDDARKLVANRVNPSQQRKDDRAAIIAATENTFGAIAKDYLQKLEGEGCAESTIEKNRWLLEDLAASITDRPAADIKPAEVLAILKTIEKSGRRDTAHRLRGTIGSAFRFAIANQKVENDPTFALRGALLKVEVNHGRRSPTKPGWAHSWSPSMSTMGGQRSEQRFSSLR